MIYAPSSPVVLAVIFLVSAIIVLVGVVAGWAMALAQHRRNEIAMRKLAEAVAASVVRNLTGHGRN